MSGSVGENFSSVTLGSLRTLCIRSAKRITLEFFHLLEALEDCKRRWNIFQRKIGISHREIWSYFRTMSSRVIEKFFKCQALEWIRTLYTGLAKNIKFEIFRLPGRA